MSQIVLIEAAKLVKESGRPSIIEPDPVYEDIDEVEDAWGRAKSFISEHSGEKQSTLTTFWGTWEGVRVFFLCNDNGIAMGLKPNKKATLAYLDQCIPGTMHVVVGPAVGLLDPELW